MARIILYCYILLLRVSSIYSLPPEPLNSKHIENTVNKNENVRNEKTEHVASVPEVNLSLNKNDETKISKVEVGDKKKENVLSSGDTISSQIATEDNSNMKTNANTDVESGAVVRGIFVFVGITLLFIIYIAAKTYRRRNKKNVLIKKYGVRTRRSDLEMEPLPLDEDEDDETVFDLGSVNNR